MALFRELVEAAEAAGRVSGRKEKVRILSEFLGRLSPEEASIAARFLAGHVFPEYDNRELGVGYSLVREALKVLDQKPLFLVEPQPPAITEVYRLLERIAGVSGEGSREKKLKLLEGLFSRLSRKEVEYLLRILFGEVRIGASTGLLLEAISRLSGVPYGDVLHAYMVLSDVGDVAFKALESPAALGKVDVSLFHPVKPMLADMAYSVDELFQEHGSPLHLEYKYDGLRVQIHMGRGKVRVFSRRLSDITEYVPDVVERAVEGLRVEEAVVDGEAVAVIGGAPVPFQELLRRVRRKNEREDFLKSLPFELHLFDVIYLNGKSLVREPYSTRSQLLREIVVSEEILAKKTVAYTRQEALEFYESAVRSGNEGVMSKRHSSVYKPGIRGSDWLKLKSFDTIDCVIIAAEWGHGRRSGWLSDYHLGVYDEESGRFLSVGKTFKGLSDAEFEEMTKRLLQLKVREEGYVVYVKPEIVVEVDYSEIQRSKRYPSGFALRFARIRRIRFDKSPYEVTTLRELRERYLRSIRAKRWSPQ